MIDPGPVALATEDHYPVLLRLLENAPAGRILDVPAGHGAFARKLVQAGWRDIDCLDINPGPFVVRDPSVRFTAHDANRPLPFPDGCFQYTFSIEGIEHFESPWTFVKELCRVTRPGGRIFITTPNTFSVDARLKYLMSGYFPRFRPLMQTPAEVLGHPIDDQHISPIYFWQLNFFLLQGGARISRIEANTVLYKPQWIKRVFEEALAGLIRRNMRRRGFPDPGISSDAVLFGDCLVIEAIRE